MRVGIVGGGFVGSATALLECKDIEVITYDINPSRCKPTGITIEDLKTCDFVFVCVPTPTYESGECNLSIVEECIDNLKKHDVKNIILRSTVPPGTSRRLDVSFMPEFLTEANWKNDFYNCTQWVFGITNMESKEQIIHLFETAKQNGSIKISNCLFVSQDEAELIKYTRNNFLALKISFFNEIYSLCTQIGVNFDHIKEGVCADGRIGSSHTSVPGPDGHFGFGGTCLPKDTSALGSFMKQQNIASPIIDAMVYRNKHIDRSERDWEHDPRAFTKH